MQPLLTLQPRTTSLLDLSVADNNIQARHEFDRARDLGNAADLAAWALRWGPSAVDVADDRDGEIARLERDLTDAEQEAKDAAIVDTDDLIEDLEEAKKHLSEARALVEKLPKAKIVDDLDEHLEVLADALADALKEANRL